MSVSFEHLVAEAAALLDMCRSRQLTVATGESCTGGLIAGILTEVPGSSDVVDRGFVTYSNTAKSEMLGVPAELIDRHGAVSEPVARAMAEGVLRHSPADLAVAVTGIAGPGGGTADKPVGLVHLAAIRRGGTIVQERRIFDDNGRSAIRLDTVAAAFVLLLDLAKSG
jgi:nicotinamide-nucleotide amidase